MDELLNLIAGADPTNDQQMDDVNFRFHAWRLKIDKQATSLFRWGDTIHIFDHHQSLDTVPVHHWNVSRSRDALKAHRPDGWLFDLDWISAERFTGQLYKSARFTSVHFQSLLCPTEELAELYALVLAINYMDAENGNQ
jgi:hypothetical protein